VFAYCVFRGDGPCREADKEGVTLNSDTYTIEATVLSNSGQSKTVTRTFVVPVITYLDIIVPPTDGTTIANIADTDFEAEGWDTTVGLLNGDGITSITFTLNDPLGTPIHTFNDTTAPFCAFDGLVVCNNSAAGGVTLPSDPLPYTLIAEMLTVAGPPTSLVSRTFFIP